ncbi:hypothetical protein GCM10009612_73270 [Streptomyces beijiangensis]
MSSTPNTSALVVDDGDWRGLLVFQETCMTRKPWDLAFLAEPQEVAALRRIVRTHLGLWGELVPL